MSQFTIQQVAVTTGLSVHTLRYYERIKLIIPVERAANGHRRYSTEDVERIKLLNRLLATKMPLDQARRYAQLFMEGDSSVQDRTVVLQAHRERVMNQIKELHETLAVIDRKLMTYQAKTRN